MSRFLSWSSGHWKKRIYSREKWKKKRWLMVKQVAARLKAYSQGLSLGLQPTPREVKEERRKMHKKETVTVDLLYRAGEACR